MSIKKTIHERCPRCGETAARLLPNGNVAVSHQCKQAPPGPPSPPVTYRACEVDFVPATKPPEDA